MTKKFLSVIFSLALLFITAVPAFAETTESVKTSVVTFLCKVDDGIETDDYSPVVVCIMNEKTYDKYEFKLYKYNSFSERYEIPNGVYTIVYARIDNRNDMIFNVVADDEFQIGKIKTIYFELTDSRLMVTETTTATTATQIITSSDTEESTEEEKTLHTLYDLSNITNGTSTGENIDTSAFQQGEISTGEENSEISDTEITEITTYPAPTTDAVQGAVADNNAKSGLKVIIIAASLIVLVAAAVITLIIIHRKGGKIINDK